MPTRREFLCAAAGAPLALQARSERRNCIVIVLNGGASQLDTWDPKPDTPSEIRGPFRAIRTNVAGIRISEIFPRMAKCADRYTLIRSVYSDAGPHSHEEALRPIDEATREFTALSGLRNLTRACDLIESGVRQIRVDMYDTIFHQPTWDSHGVRPFSTIRDYPDTVAPAFDLGFTRLLENLRRSGLFDSTLVVALSEFGRGPKINPMGGRDHWPYCQTVIVAGGGTEGGQIAGSSDAIGAEPKDNPLSLSALLASIFQSPSTNHPKGRSRLSQVSGGNAPQPQPRSRSHTRQAATEPLVCGLPFAALRQSPQMPGARTIPRFGHYGILRSDRRQTS